jgi:arginine utilization protein RocB
MERLIKEISEKLRVYALSLTEVISVVGTKGEVNAADRVYSIMSQFPYFKDNPKHLVEVFVPDDQLGRKSILAYLNGTKEPSKKTVVLIGHIDTVGIDDYGDYKVNAGKPYELIKNIEKTAISEESRKDLESGDWLFGRGIFDMKCGVAANMALIEVLSQNTNCFKGNIIFIAVPDEEGSSAGMLSALSYLRLLKERDGLEYFAVVDTDYMAPLYQGDENKYIYLGTVGKLLPSFYIIGKETHVGQAFEGLDPNLIASEIMTEVDLSEDLCDIVDGESTVPPISLRQQDLKGEYSVQTASSANIYFNYSTHSQLPHEVLEKLVKKAEIAFERVIERLNKRYKFYCQSSGFPYKELPWKSRVFTFNEYYNSVKKLVGEGFDQYYQDIKERLKEQDLDDREYSLKLLQQIHGINPDKDPAVIVYYAPPYYPHIYVEKNQEKGKFLTDVVREVVKRYRDKTGENLTTKMFYPYISDLSYCAVTEDNKAIESLRKNMPAWPDKYNLPIDDIKALNVPVVNIGPFGKDAHKFTERLHMPYSFEVMPGILFETVLELLK